jgi:hypothetical protein
MAISDLVSGAALHKQFLNERGDAQDTVDFFLCCGQSNSAGSTPVPNTVPFTTSAGVAYSGQYGVRSPQMLATPFQNGGSVTPGWGQSNAWPHFAEQWYLDTGRRSVWFSFAVAGTCLRKESIPGTSQHWDVSELSKCLAADMTYTDGGETKPRRDMYADVLRAITLNPKVKLGKRYVTWVQGEADANGVSVTSPAQYQERLDALFTFMKTTYAIDHFGIVGLGRKGDNESLVDQWEADSYAGIRGAQTAVANARADTTLIFSGMKEKGTPFNTLTVDANYLHLAGMAYQSDGVHLTSEGYRCMGRTAARNMAVALNLKI